MNLNKNYMSKYVIGKEYSYGTLKSMSKDTLIELLNTAQHNYECVNERLFNLGQYAEKLDQALDKACELLESATEDEQLLCPCEYLGICHCENTESGYECSGDVDYKWKDALMKDE